MLKKIFKKSSKASQKPQVRPSHNVSPSIKAVIPWEPTPRLDAVWKATHASFVDNSLKNGASINLLFTGDSLTQGWEGPGRSTYDQFYASLGTANYGIRADRTEHLLWRIQNGEVQHLQPKVGVLMIGTNNLGVCNDSDIARGILANVDELKGRLPRMKILLLGVLPQTSEAGVRRISNINSIISEVDNGTTIRFLDMNNHFYKGGDDFVTELYGGDRLHLSGAGYAKWAEVMNPVLFEMLK